MSKTLKNLFVVILLAMLMVAVTNCTKQNSESSEATKIAQGVQTALAEATALEAAVQTRVQGTQSAAQGTVPPTVIQPADTPTIDLNATVIALQATETALAEPVPQETTPAGTQGPVTILSPADRSTVTQYQEVSGGVDESALAGKFLNLIITTRTGEFWVQKAPGLQGNGTWSAYPVVFGQIDIGKGEDYIVCAVISDQQLVEGRIYTYPDGPKACITVTRGNN